MKVGFRVDASYQIGSGHLVRCLSLAKELREKNIESIFITKKNKGDLISLIIKNKFKFTIINYKKKSNDDLLNWKLDAIETAKKIKNKGITHLIIDHYGIEKKWEEYLNDFVNKIIVIDDLADRKHFCDILIDNSLPKKNYLKLVPSHSKILVGPEFIFLDKSFIEERSKMKKIENEKEEKKHIFYVSYGASDITQETIKTIIALKKLKNKISFEAKIIVGKNNKQKKKIKELCYKDKKNFSYFEQPFNVANIMSKCSIGIGSPGTTTWERCFMGLPSILISVAENQIKIGNACNDLNIAMYVGNSAKISSDSLRKIIMRFLQSPKKILEFKKNGLKVVDGYGTKKVLNSIIELSK